MGAVMDALAFAAYVTAYDAVVGSESLRVPEKVAYSEEITTHLMGRTLTPAQKAVVQRLAENVWRRKTAG